jgi:hypothetical protein
MAGYVGTKAVLLSTTAANVGGDADVSGDLTVDTNTLHVDSTNNRVGVGTISPSAPLQVQGSAGEIRLQRPTASQADWSFKLPSSGGELTFYDNNNSSEAMRITSAGYIEAASASQVRLTLGSEGTAGTNNANWIRGNGTSLGFNSASGGYQWEIGGSEAMRLDSSSTLLIGRTAAVSGTTRLGLDATASIAGFVSETGPTSTVTHARFFNGNGNIGNISTNGSATTYATSSDYRLKENVVELTSATTRLNQLAPKRFNFIADDATTVDGFLAHEVQAVVPEAITGEKDAVDAEGNPEYQGIDQSKLVPLLTAALQEALTEITDLKARVAALETP